MANLRAHFDEHITEILDDLVKMSRKVEKMLKRSCSLLESIVEEQADDVDAQKERQQLGDIIIKDDTYVDIHEISIDDHCVRLIATEQPVASDLRKLISITKATSDLERIGDIARYIAIKLKKEILEPFRTHIPAIIATYNMAINMFSRAIEAFVDGDEQSSRTVAAEDDSIDEQHREIQRALIQEMKGDPDYIKNGQIMLEIIRLIELLGDRVTSICEWTIYAIQGKHTDLN